LASARRDIGQRAPAFYKRRRKRSNEIGQVLLRSGVVTPEQLREALKIQSELGGQIGAILKSMGACDARAIAEALIEQLHATRDRGRNLAQRARENPSIVGLQMRCRPRLSLAVSVLVDLIAVGIGGGLVAALLAGDALTRSQRLSVAVLVPLCIAALATAQLYAHTPPSPPEELRRSTIATWLVYAGSWAVAALAPHGAHGAFNAVSHGAWLAGWIVSAVLIPTGRGILRWKCAPLPWWGQAVVVLGAGKVGRAVVSTLQRRPQLGLKPVAILDDDPQKHGAVRATWGEDDLTVQSVRQGPDSTRDEESASPSARRAIEQFAEVEGVPVVGGLELAPALAQRLGIRSVVIAMPKMDSTSLLSVIERYAESFSSVLVIPDLFTVTHFGAPTRNLGGVLGIEVRRQLLLTGPRMAKRALDILLTTIGGLLILPFILFVGLLIKLDSKGTIFYQQKRLGQDGVRFVAYKFRTMYGDGEHRLQEVLARDPKLRAEYEEFHKLTDDPRVTRIGRFLRRYSLDELPQVWSVFVGDMSLVGPRPYLEREIPEMGGQEAIILRVRPGITGIWQVTERNASTFEERVQLDVEYVRSWSIWLDIYVLARTVPVVLGGTGS
jgi:lipopolysaccharide/colanic/teichoic acid biosynthesis glycosyltransferase